MSREARKDWRQTFFLVEQDETRECKDVSREGGW